jgi:hypothetical protein
MPISARERVRANPAAEPSLSLLDELFEKWVSWREACEDVRSSYEHWRRCNAAQRDVAFASYRAALDREDQAARVYSAWTDRLHAETG